jgi:hypothetical protein
MVGFSEIAICGLLVGCDSCHIAATVCCNAWILLEYPSMLMLSFYLADRPQLAVMKVAGSCIELLQILANTHST